MNEQGKINAIINSLDIINNIISNHEKSIIRMEETISNQEKLIFHLNEKLINALQ